MDQYLDELVRELETNRLQLPSLPQVALRIRTLVESSSTSTTELAKAITLDPALAARLLRVANSVLYFRGGKSIEDVSQAVVRLGRSLLSNMVNILVVEQLYQNRSLDLIKVQLTDLWKHSVRVAAISHVLAKRYTEIAAEQALLAGLVHDIGTLYLLQRMCEQAPELFETNTPPPNVLMNMHAAIGAKILEAWEFNPDLVAVAQEHNNISRDIEGPADLVDIVIVANLHAKLTERRQDEPVTDWTQVTAFHRLGMDPAKSIEILRGAAREIAEIEQMLNG